MDHAVACTHAHSEPKPRSLLVPPHTPSQGTRQRRARQGLCAFLLQHVSLPDF